MGPLVRALTMIAACACSLGRVPAAEAAPAYGPGWSAAHADSSNSNFAPVAGASSLRLAWHRKLGGPINLGATSDGAGRLYVTSAGPAPNLRVLDRATGEIVWESRSVDEFAVASSALIDDRGRAFIADSRAMRAFDGSGNELWATPIEGFPLSAQFTPAGNLIFITNIGRIEVLDRETGARRMPTVELIPGARFDPSKARAAMRGTRDCPSANTLAIDEESGTFFFTFWAPDSPDAGIRAMRLVEGGGASSVDPLWENDILPGGSGSSPILSADGSRVYVNDNVDSIHALDAATGREIWRFAVGHAAGGCSSISPEGIIMPAGGRLLALRDAGGSAELLWRHEDQLNRGIPTQAANGIAYPVIASAGWENDLLVLDVASGNELDRERLPGITIFSVGTTIGSEGYVYVPTISGDLFAFAPVK